MMRRRLYLFSLWLATCSVLLSSIILHHHHYDRICFVEERCMEDGNVNDEHTEHHENEQEGCCIQQSHHFLLNAKLVKTIQKNISDGSLALVAILPVSYIYFPTTALVISQWQEQAFPLSDGKHFHPDRRGSPYLS